MAVRSKSVITALQHVEAPPKRTSIGHGRRQRNTQGRTKRSPSRKLYRGQG